MSSNRLKKREQSLFFSRLYKPRFWRLYIKHKNNSPLF